MLVLLLALHAPAQALTSHQGGPALDLAAGLGMGGRPLKPAVGGQLSLGWWAGTYDDQYAFGRYWWIGPTARVDWNPDALAITPMLELRRGLELFVAGVAPFLAGGVTLSIPAEGAAPPLGWTARGGVQLKLRRTRFFGLSLRLEGGADGVGDAVGFAGGALLGVSWARPARAITAPE